MRPRARTKKTTNHTITTYTYKHNSITIIDNHNQSKIRTKPHTGKTVRVENTMNRVNTYDLRLLVNMNNTFLSLFMS